MAGTSGSTKDAQIVNRIRDGIALAIKVAIELTELRCCSKYVNVRA